jgi:hypothetical protein
MKKLILVIAISIGIAGCNALFEDNLSKSTVTLLFPIGGDSINTYNINFYWNTVKYANTYEVQIVQGTFAHIQNFIVDSTVSSPNLLYSLSPGAYQWRVRALNNSTQSNYFTQSFSVLLNDSLSAQTVILQSPQNNFYTNVTTQTFRWYALPQVTYYTFQLTNSTGGIIYSTNTTVDSIVLSLQQGSMQWSVRGNNNTSSTSFSGRTIFVDSIVPGIPVIVSPTYADSVSAPVSLNWSNGSNGGAPIIDSVFIYSDSLVTSYQKFTDTATSYSINSIPTGTYFWRVRSLDLAGNVGGYSLPGKFIVH